MLTVGIEEEFLLVDRDGRLARFGPEVVKAADEQQGELTEELSRSQVESATGVCAGGEELLGQLTHLRAELGSKAASRGLRLLPSAMPLLEENRSAGITPKRRYEWIAKVFGEVARSATSCGCHVHVGIPDRATGIAISNHLRPWLPVLLALSANSPFADGLDTEYSSWRYVQWSQWPSSGPPPLFESLAHYEDSVDAMLRSGAVLDRGMVYWDIRLSDNQPTLEFRVSDVAATPREAALLGVVVRGLVDNALRDIESGVHASTVRLEVLRAFLWRAARDGLGGQCPDPRTGNLMPGQAIPALLAEQLRPVLPVEELDFMLVALKELGRSGGGAQRQRAVYARNHRLTDVIDELVRNCGS